MDEPHFRPPIREWLDSWCRSRSLDGGDGHPLRGLSPDDRATAHLSLTYLPVVHAFAVSGRSAANIGRTESLVADVVVVVLLKSTHSRSEDK